MYDHLLAPQHKFLEYLHRSIYWLHNHTTKLLGLKVDERKRVMDAGNWYGNDSAWRMTVDLPQGFSIRRPQRQPAIHAPAPRIFGDRRDRWRRKKRTPGTGSNSIRRSACRENLLAVDVVGARLMGFDPTHMRLYRSLLSETVFDLGVRGYGTIEVVSEPGIVERMPGRQDKSIPRIQTTSRMDRPS